MYQKFTEIEKKAFIQAYYSQPLETRLSQAKFARKSGLSQSSFNKWIREYSADNFSYDKEPDPKESDSIVTTPSGFIEVKSSNSSISEPKPEIKFQDKTCCLNNNIVITKHDLKIELPINIGLDQLKNILEVLAV